MSHRKKKKSNALDKYQHLYRKNPSDKSESITIEKNQYSHGIFPNRILGLQILKSIIVSCPYDISTPSVKVNGKKTAFFSSSDRMYTARTDQIAFNKYSNK